MNNPKLNEYVSNCGGGMYICEIINDSNVIVKHFAAPWLKVACRISRYKGNLCGF